SHNPRVQENGVRLAERWLRDSPAVQERVLRLAKQGDAQVRFQAALSLGEWQDERALDGLVAGRLAGVEDRWTRAAVASSAAGREAKLIDAFLRACAAGHQDGPGYLAAAQELVVVVGSRRRAEEVASALDAFSRLPGPQSLR